MREEFQAFRTQVNQELSQLRSTLNRITTTLDRLTPHRDVPGGGEPPQG
jgi:16S rRNA C1402 N4-methylase RsmH